MLNDLWNAIRGLFGLNGSWEMMTLSRVGVDPLSLRALTQVLQPVHTIRLRPERDDQAAPAADGLELTWHGITDTGMVRQNNEDNLAHVEIGDDALFIVADGIGGHDAGEVASSIAADAVEREVRTGRRWNEDPLRVIERSAKRANRLVHADTGGHQHPRRRLPQPSRRHRRHQHPRRRLLQHSPPRRRHRLKLRRPRQHLRLLRPRRQPCRLGRMSPLSSTGPA